MHFFFKKKSACVPSYTIFTVHGNLEFHGVQALLAEVNFPQKTFVFKSVAFFKHVGA